MIFVPDGAMSEADMRAMGELQDADTLVFRYNPLAGTPIVLPDRRGHWLPGGELPSEKGLYFLGADGNEQISVQRFDPGNERDQELEGDMHFWSQPIQRPDPPTVAPSDEPS